MYEYKTGKRMKYITTKTEDGIEEIFIFPSSINHDAMAEALEGIKNGTHGDWERVYRRPISAGYVDIEGRCFGYSVSLDLESRKEDTKLLAKQPEKP